MENLARRIKLTRVTKENLRLKILEVKGASCVPCSSIGGASPGLAPNKPASKAIMLTSWQHHMDSVAERSKAVAQGHRQGVGSNPTAVIPTHQTDRCRWSQATPPFFSFCFWMCLRNHHQAETTSGVAQWLACWAHNPKGAWIEKAPLWSAMICFHASSVLLQCRVTRGCSGN